MDIGNKLQKARLNANLTQEQASEALGVSRQTISNWENEKTYPDIVSVVKMSDIYSISLDLLLKEDKNMSNYVNYLDESTNVVESKKGLAKLILIVTYLGIWALSLLVFWFFTSPSDAMGYGVMFLWFLLPVATFVISILIGRNGYWGKLMWVSAALFGLMYMLADYATFGVSNMDSFNQFILPEFTMILAGGVISCLGLGIGYLVRRYKEKKQI